MIARILETTVTRRRLLRVARGVSVVAAVASGAMPARAQGDDAAATHRGALVLKADQQLGWVNPSAARQHAGYVAAEQLVTILRRDAALAAPVGYATVVHRVAGVTNAGDGLAPNLPPHFGVTGAINYYAMESDDHGGQRIGDGGGSFPFSVVVNGVGRITDDEQVTLPLDHGPPVLTDYRKTGEFRGHPVYNGECVFITRRAGLLPFVPLPKARYLTLQILKARADSVRHAGEHRTDNGHNTSDALAQWLRERPKREAQMRSTLDAVKAMDPDPKKAQEFIDAWRQGEADAEARLREGAASGGDARMKQIEHEGEAIEGANLASLQAQLDGLSAAQRAAPTSLELRRGSDRLTETDDPSSSPLVQLNSGFFDKTLPPETPQVVTVCLPGLQASSEIEKWEAMTTAREEWSDRRARDAARIRDQLDWASLEALVKP